MEGLGITAFLETNFHQTWACRLHNQSCVCKFELYDLFLCTRQSLCLLAAPFARRAQVLNVIAAKSQLGKSSNCIVQSAPWKVKTLYKLRELLLVAECLSASQKCAAHSQRNNATV
jgi:hypothetical protein